MKLSYMWAATAVEDRRKNAFHLGWQHSVCGLIVEIDRQRDRQRGRRRDRKGIDKGVDNGENKGINKVLDKDRFK